MLYFGSNSTTIIFCQGERVEGGGGYRVGKESKPDSVFSILQVL